MTLVIGHRGAPGERPEHTLASYELAARRGADHIEPDLVITRDGVLIARHEPELSSTTDVAGRPEFAARRTSKDVGGVPTSGWFAEDFTLAEVKTLRARERIPQVRPRNVEFDGRFEVPTFQEVVELRERLSRELGREIGIYPETKHPAYFRSQGLPLEEPLVAALRRNGLDDAHAPVFVQSFDPAGLRALARVLAVPLVQLLGRREGDMAAPDALREIAGYARGVGPSKDYIVPRDAAGGSLAPTSFVADAHAAGLLVHPYTFRAENMFLPLELRSSGEPAERGDLAAEIRQFIDLGIDGLFTDDANTAVAARAGR
jgi:glycerophosphoryl diester phosphodiesterase